MDRRPVISAFVLLLVDILPAGAASQATAAQGATLAAASPVATGDFSGLVDICGRKLYLECRGQVARGDFGSGRLRAGRPRFRVSVLRLRVYRPAHGRTGTASIVGSSRAGCRADQSGCLSSS